MDEREEYINKVCDGIKERMDEEAKKEAMSEKEKFMVAIETYKKSMAENVENLEDNIRIQALTVSILKRYLDTNIYLDEKVVEGINNDINTKEEIISNANKAIKMMEYKLSKIDEVKDFMSENYDIMKEINFMFDNCLKLNGEYSNKIAEFDV